MVTEIDLELPDGRTLHVYDTAGEDGRLAVLWHHGTPNLGPPPEPLFPAADVAVIADALEIGRFAVMGHSGGSNHALASGALLPARVLGAVCMSGLAPPHAEGLDWFAGMADAGAAELGAATRGRAALVDHLSTTDFDPEQFTPADHADLAYVAPWGFAPAEVRVPVLLVHGGQDRVVPSSHGRWLASRITSAELWLRPEDGHVSVLGSAGAALGWLRERASEG